MHHPPYLTQQQFARFLVSFGENPDEGQFFAKVALPFVRANVNRLLADERVIEASSGSPWLDARRAAPQF
jgi:hypothetical protein